MLASPITRRTPIIVFVVLAALLAGAPVVIFRLADPEQRNLDDEARAQASGQFARLTNGYTHYEVAGPPAGRAVVLAAGATVPCYIWDPTFAALAKAGFRVLRYDYYGRGFSDRPDVPYTQDFYVRQLTELLDAAGMHGPVDLVGLSMGASVVTSAADRKPDLVRSLIYVDPAFRIPYDAGLASTMPLVWNFMTAVFYEKDWPRQQLSDFVHPERVPDWPDRYRVQMRYRGFRRARLSEIVANAGVDQGEEVARVGAHSRPVLAIWGKQDRTVPFELSERLLHSMPRARLVAVDDAGHLPHLEQPAIVNAAMIDFLRQ
jgi:pimeloyl-ACP methyl ester carboxylesterase